MPLALIMLSAALPICQADRAPSDATGGADSSRPAEPNEILLYRLDETFRHVSAAAIQAYFDHFEDEPAKLAVVHYYAGRLALVQGRPSDAAEHLRESIRLGTEHGQIIRSDWFPFAKGADTFLERALLLMQTREQQNGPPVIEKKPVEPPVTVQHALAASSAAELRQHLETLGSRPHAMLTRDQAEDGVPAASCPFYDPELLTLHVRLAESMRAGRAVYPDMDARELAQVQTQLRVVRGFPDDRELSLRKFLEKHRALVWRLGWLYRCYGLEQEQRGGATSARVAFLRAAAIGNELFSASQRGRLDQFDPVFLAELGDVYARLGRYDLMLRYMYSEQGLPARYELARPIAELARVAESVRLARRDETPADQLDEVLPETVSQILFDEPVPTRQPSGGAPVAAAADGPRGPSGVLGWVLVGGGVVLVIAAAAGWRLSRANRTRFDVWSVH